jgi:hypothetical protein
MAGQARSRVPLLSGAGRSRGMQQIDPLFAEALATVAAPADDDAWFSAAADKTAHADTSLHSDEAFGAASLSDAEEVCERVSRRPDRRTRHARRRWPRTSVGFVAGVLAMLSALEIADITRLRATNQGSVSARQRAATPTRARRHRAVAPRPHTRRHALRRDVPRDGHRRVLPRSITHRTTPPTHRKGDATAVLDVPPAHVTRVVAGSTLTPGDLPWASDTLASSHDQHTDRRTK